MTIQSFIQSIDLTASFFAAVAHIILGSLWYSPSLNGHHWLREKKITDSDLKNGVSLVWLVVLSFVLPFISALGISGVITQKTTIIESALIGLIISMIWVSTSRASTMIHESESKVLFIIHASFDVISYVMMSIIICLLT